MSAKCRLDVCFQTERIKHTYKLLEYKLLESLTDMGCDEKEISFMKKIIKQIRIERTIRQLERDNAEGAYDELSHHRRATYVTVMATYVMAYCFAFRVLILSVYR